MVTASSSSTDDNAGQSSRKMFRRPSVTAAVLNTKLNNLRHLVQSSIAQSGKRFKKRGPLTKLSSKYLEHVRVKRARSEETTRADVRKRLRLQRGNGEDNYAEQDYWEQRYAKGDEVKKEFEWFLSYEDVHPLLESTINYEDRTALFVDIGCGTSMFLRDLKRAGYQGRCLGLDFSKNAVDTMTAREDCAGIDFRVCDATQLDAVAKSITVILDKSLMDTMLHADDESMAAKMLQAVGRSVHPEGVFISITQLDPRKQGDLAFMQSFVLGNLSMGSNKVTSVTAHVTSPGAPVKGRAEGKLEVPSVIIYRFSHSSKKDAEVEVDIVEYEASDDGQ